MQVAPVQPIVQPIMAQQPAQQAPAQQAPVAAQVAPQAAQIVAPVATTDKLRGTPPDTFKGDSVTILGPHPNFPLFSTIYFALSVTHSLTRSLTRHSDRHQIT